MGALLVVELLELLKELALPHEEMLQLGQLPGAQPYRDPQWRFISLDMLGPALFASLRRRWRPVGRPVDDPLVLEGGRGRGMVLGRMPFRLVEIR